MAIAKVLLTRRMPENAARLLRAAGVDVDAVDSDAPLPRAELLRRAAGAAGIIAMLSEKIDDELLTAAGPALRIVANYAVGYDNIDLEACRRRGVRATNTPGVLTNATADIAWALILATARRVVEGDRLMRTGQWRGWSPMELLGVELSGATLGILGAGRIGSAVARRAVGFEMRVIYCHPRANAELERVCGARRVELDELVRESDVLSLHAPMRPGNHHLLSRARLEQMKPTAILINTARGPLLDEAALVEFLRERRIAAAGFDVYEHEPRLSPGLSDLPNVVLLPHLGSATTATRARMAEMAAQNVLAVLAGREPPNPIG